MLMHNKKKRNAFSIAAIFVVLLIVSLAGCGDSSSNDNKDNDAAQVYIEMAQDYLDGGDYDAAVEVLKKGLSSTGDAEIGELLKEAIEKQLAADKGEETPSGDQQTNNPHGESKEDTPSPSNNNGNNTSPDVPNQEQIRADIVACGANSFSINNQSEFMNITELELLRRKTDTDYDEAYVSVVFENEYYAVDAELVLYYEFYDVGGWVLEHYEIINSISRVIKSPYNEATFVSFACESFDDCTVTNRDNGINADGAYYEDITFSGTRNYAYSSIVITGRYTLTFYNNIWYEECYFEHIATDWSGMLGTWQYNHENGDYITFDMISIDIYDAQNTSITYSYSSSPWKWLGIQNRENNTSYSCPVTTKDYSLSWKTETLMGIETKIPSGIFMMVDLGNSRPSNLPNNSGHLTLDKDDGGKMVYWDNGNESTSVTLEKTN